MTVWYKPTEFNWERGTKSQRALLIGQAVATKLPEVELDDRQAGAVATVQDGVARLRKHWKKRIGELVEKAHIEALVEDASRKNGGDRDRLLRFRG